MDKENRGGPFLPGLTDTLYGYLIIIRGGRLSGKEQEADGIGGEVGAEVYHPGEP